MPISGSTSVLTLDNFNTQGAFKSDDETLLISLTQQVALSFENVRLMQAMRERAGQLQALNDVATSLTSSLRSDQLVGSLLDNLTPILPFDSAAFWFREGDQLTVVATRGYPEPGFLGASVGVTRTHCSIKCRRQAGNIHRDVREDAFPLRKRPAFPG
jgi:GAF domain-containing protein